MSSASGTDPHVRTRFAPSPTGPLHLGGARTALFAYAMAKKAGGSFIVRYEDTDPGRSREEFREEIRDSLNWLGLTPDEDDQRGGPYAPYLQSQRLPRYEEALRALRSAGSVYPCFCTRDRLANLKTQLEARRLPPRYDGACAQLPAEDVKRRQDSGEAFTLRFRIPRDTVREVVFEDLIHGPMTFRTRDLEDFVLVRDDGSPLFLLPSVVDDIAMKISHVLRGDDHLANTPKQILLAHALGATPPIYAHMPLVLGADGQPLSKRHGDLSISTFRREGILPDALCQALLLLGWSPEVGVEMNEPKTLVELVQLFSLARVHKSPARFDDGRIRSLNRAHIRRLAASDPAALQQLVASAVVAASSEIFSRLAPLAAEEAETLTEFSATYLTLAEAPDRDRIRNDLLTEIGEPLSNLLRHLIDHFSAASVFDSSIAASLAEKASASKKQVHLGLRLALTGQRHGPKLADLVEGLGATEVVRRLQAIC